MRKEMLNRMKDWFYDMTGKYPGLVIAYELYNGDYQIVLDIPEHLQECKELYKDVTKFYDEMESQFAFNSPYITFGEFAFPLTDNAIRYCRI